MGYIIVGDTEKFKDCLIYTIAGDRKFAEEVLERMKTNPSKMDKLAMEHHINVRIEETKPEDEWWNDPFLAN